MRRVTAVAAATLAIAPATAEAASVTAGADGVRYVAGAGEANRLLVTYESEARLITLADPGATIATREGCVALDPHTARCPTRPGASAIRAELGDGDDTLATAGIAPTFGVTADGGAGDDRLVGDDGANELRGGPGDDVLVGRAGVNRGIGGGDVLDGGSGDDRLLGGDDIDDLYGRSGRDVLGCGGGRDFVLDPARREHLPRTCELIRDYFGPERVHLLEMSPHPLRLTPVGAHFGVPCPHRPESGANCSATMTLREARGGRRLLGRGTLPFAEGQSSHELVVAFTADGRRLAARRRGVAAVVALRGFGLPRTGWTIRLRIPRG